MHSRPTARHAILGVVLSVLVALPVPLAGQTPPVPADSTAKGEAYRLFLLGLHRHKAGDIEGAIQAYRNAAELDRESGEALAELASLHAGRDELEQAIEAAADAVARDPDNLTAHRILGLVFAHQSGQRRAPPETVARAVEHLEKARGTIVPDLQVELTLARLYLGQRRADDAISLLERLLEDQPGLSQVAQVLSEAYEDAGRADDAVAIVEQAVASGRPSSRLLRRLGELYGRQDRWDAAIQAYEAAVARNPRSRGAQRELGNALLRSGQLERGRDVFEQLTTTRPDDGAALYRLSEVELELGDLDAAAEAAERLIDVEPNGIRGPYALAEVHTRRHDFKRVVETLEPVIQIAREGNLPGNQIASLLGRVGFAYEQLQDHDGAAAIYAEATELLPTSLGFGERLVESYLDAGRQSDARVALERIQAQYPGDLSLARLEARLFAEGGDVSGGVDVLQVVLAANDGDPMAHIALAMFYNDYDRADEAVDVLLSAQQRFPDNESLLFQLGAVMEQNDRFAEAERAFRQILERDPQNAATLNYLGYMLADRNDRLEESVGLLERAIQIDPHNGAYLDSLGWAYFKLDRLDLAETHLRQASEQMVWNSVIQDHLGDLLYRLGRYEEAIAAWETALAGDGAEVESSAIERKMEDARQRLGR